MEGKMSLVVAMALMMAMLVATLGQAQTQSQSQDQESLLLDMDVHQTASTGKCLKKCGIKCCISIINPPAFALCFTPCMAACKFLPSQALTSCTANCANSMLLAHSPDSEGIGEEKMGDYVASCFQSCQAN